MSRSVFGWSYPPGAENDPRAPWNEPEPVCDVCGLDADHCICPECPVCKDVGNPNCYLAGECGHGMVASKEQIESLEDALARGGEPD